MSDHDRELQRLRSGSARSDPAQGDAPGWDIPKGFRWLACLAAALLVLTANQVYADNGALGSANKNDKDVRYTCRDHAIDIHRLRYANVTDVSEYNTDWLGTGVRWDWKRPYTVRSGWRPAIEGWLSTTAPVTRTCDLWSGPYVIKFGVWSLGEGLEVWPTVTIVHAGKTVIPTTVLGMCDTSRFGETGICKRFAVRIFLFEAVDDFRDGKPVGINKPDITMYRIRKDTYVGRSGIGGRP